MVKNQRASAEDARDVGLIPGSRRYHGVRNGNPLQYSCLENSMDRGACQAPSPWARKELDMTERLSMHIRKVFSYYLFKYFLRSFFFLFSFYDLYNVNVGALNVDPEVSQTVLISFHFFSLFCSALVVSTILSSSSLIYSSA